MNELAHKGLLHFSTRSYPTFGRGKKAAYDEANPPKTVTSSPYYWWFKFLQLNEDYKATCAANGEGKCAALYADFGDIYNTDFKSWWQSHVELFAEKRSKYGMHIAKSANELAPFDDADVVNLTVPLTWTRRTLKARFAAVILSKIEESKRGVYVEGSDAAYKLSGKWHVQALATAYQVYLQRHKASDGTEFLRTDSKTGEKKSVKRFDVSWAEIAIRAGLSTAKGITAGKALSNDSDARRVATILAMRHYKRAEDFIASAASNRFPYSNAG